MPTTHGTVVVVADDGTSPVGTDEWNAPHGDQYQPTADVELVADSMTIVQTDPLIVDSPRLIDIPDGAVLWTDAPRQVGKGFVVLNVKDYGAIGDGIADDTAALEVARVALAAVSGPARLVFPGGVYKYSVSPNWAVRDSIIEGEGEVRLRYTGTGNSVIIDGGATGPGVYNVRMRRFIVEGIGTALNGVYVRACHASQFEFKVTGSGNASAAVRTEWCVLSEFWLTISVNHEGWYQTPGTSNNEPFDGLYVASRSAPEPTSYCNFYTLDVAGVSNIGIYLSNTLGNNFFGGSSEGCSLYGVFAGLNAVGDKFWGVDFEQNTAVDFYNTGGADIALVECDSDSLTYISTGALRTRISGGRYHNLTIDGTATGVVIDGAKINRFGTGGVLSEAGVSTTVINCFNAGAGTYYPNKLQGSLQLIAGTTATAPMNVPHGSAPTSPVNGDIWTTTAGTFARVNGATVGPFGAGATAASQAEQEAGTEAAKYVAPLTQQFHKSAAKCWVASTQSSTTIQQGYNVASVADTGTGISTVTIATDFSGTTYVPIVGAEHNSASGTTQTYNIDDSGRAAGTYIIQSWQVDGTEALTDPSASWFSVCFGDQ